MRVKKKFYALLKKATTIHSTQNRYRCKRIAVKNTSLAQKKNDRFILMIILQKLDLFRSFFVQKNDRKKNTVFFYSEP